MATYAMVQNNDDKLRRKIRLNAILLGLTALGFFVTFIVLVAVRG